MPTKYLTKINYNGEDYLISGGGSSISEITVATSGAVTQELQPDTIYHFTSDALTSLILTFPPGEETKQYHFDFISPSTAVTLTLPQSVEMPESFFVDINTLYEIDILNNLGIFATWAHGGAIA